MRPTMRRWSWWLWVVIVGMAAPGVQQVPASGLASGPAPRSAARPVQESTVVEVLGREHRNVLAFARLYGVVRYFYPSDAAAGLEWDRFAVHGVKQVRAARDAAQLDAALEALFEPLGPGIEIGATLSPSPAIGKPDDRLIAWRYLGAGISGAAAPPGRGGPYRGKRTRRPLAGGAGADGFSRSATAPSAPSVPSAQSRTPASADASAPASDLELFEGAVPVSGAHDDVDLGAGLKARVPLALSEEQAVEQAANAAKLNALRAALAAVKRPGTSETGVVDDDTRLADVLITWNVFRHFYPYWIEADVDWDAQLEPHLQLARVAATRDVHRKVLRRLVAAARDGHGSVVDTWAGRDQRLRLPIRFGMVGRRVAVTASGVPADVPIGAVVSSIGGVSVVRTLVEETSLTSGSTQWKQVRALQALGVCAPGIESTDIVFSVIGVIDGSRSTGARADSGAAPDRGAGANAGADDGTQVRSVRCEAPHLVPAEPRPPAITELAPAIWYVDLTRARMQQISPELEKLASATGVVFDVRGYPTDAGMFILTHLLDAGEQDRWMHVRRITGPFGQSAGWNSLGWNLSPIEPRLTGKMVFLTDGRAISYAESVMGYIGDRKLATIVGSATAGTNGNVATFTLPGDFAISFTGMRVTGHDGEAQLHLIGVTPDILALPTIEGLRSGRDEVLERGVAAIHGR